MKIRKPTAEVAGASPKAAARSLEELPTRAPGGREHRSFAFYGRSGTGKTTIFGTFPGRKLLLDIKDVGDDSLEGLEDVRVMDIRTWDDMELTYWWLVKHPGRYDAVGLDTLTQLQILCIRKVLTDKGKDAERAGDWGVMTKKEWGQVAELMKTWIINWRDLPTQILFVAQDRTFNVGEEDDTQGLDPEVGPALSPSIAKYLNASVHFIGNTFIRTHTVRVKLKNPAKGQSPYREDRRIQFCMRVGPNPTYITKVRKAKAIELPPVVVDPTYDKLINIMTTRKTTHEE